MFSQFLLSDGTPLITSKSVCQQPVSQVSAGTRRHAPRGYVTPGAAHVADSAGAEADGGGSRKADGRWRLIVVEARGEVEEVPGLTVPPQSRVPE